MQRAQAGVFSALSRLLGNVFLVVILLMIRGTAQENITPQPAQPSSGTSLPSPETALSTGTPDKNQSNLDTSPTRLGVGDLLEVNVYGVAELSTKARKRSSADDYRPLT